MNEYGYNDNTEATVSVKDWFITLIIMMIPTVNFIMMLIWAFGGSAAPTKANFFKASLIMSVIISIVFILIFVILFFMGGLAGLSIAESSGMY